MTQTAKRLTALDELAAQAQELDMGYGPTSPRTVRLFLRIGTVSILVGLAFYGGALGGFPGIAGVAVGALVGGWAALNAQHRGVRR